MDSDWFWQLVETSRADDGDLEAQCARLVDLLAELDPEDILEFQRCFAAEVGQAYGWELWAVAEIVLGTCNDEAFDRFVGWLVAQGRAYFEAALADPARAADRIEASRRPELQAMWTAPGLAYERRTGTDEFYDIAHAVSIAMQGERLGPTRVRARFPELLARFRR
jgi:hypothetical protein